MKTLMHIAASPRIQRSHSRKLAEYFIGKFLKENPDYTLDQYDIAKGELAQFTEPGATAKFKSLRNVPMTLDETAQWIAAQDEFKRFAAADKYVFSVPMWNFGLPYHFKQYIDLITQPGWLFGADEKGYFGLCKGKSALFCCATGSFYPEKELWRDHLHPYLKYWSDLVDLNYFEVTLEGCNAEGDHEKLQAEAHARLDAIAGRF